jgi:hypothetical protein
VSGNNLDVQDTRFGYAGFILFQQPLEPIAFDEGEYVMLMQAIGKSETLETIRLKWKGVIKQWKCAILETKWLTDCKERFLDVFRGICCTNSTTLLLRIELDAVVHRDLSRNELSVDVRTPHPSEVDRLRSVNDGKWNVAKIAGVLVQALLQALTAEVDGHQANVTLTKLNVGMPYAETVTALAIVAEMAEMLPRNSILKEVNVKLTVPESKLDPSLILFDSMEFLSSNDGKSNVRNITNGLVQALLQPIAADADRHNANVTLNKLLVGFTYADKRRPISIVSKMLRRNSTPKELQVGLTMAVNTHNPSVLHHS